MSSGNLLEQAQLTPSEVQDAVKYMNEGSSQLSSLADMFSNRSSQLGFDSGSFQALHGK